MASRKANPKTKLNKRMAKDKQSKEPKRPVGRPSSYTQEMADIICAQLSNGDSLRKVCLPAEMPDRVTVFKWMRTYPEFLNQYARAKEESADAMADEILDISDNGTNDKYTDEFGRIKVDNDVIQRSRLRVDTRKWLMAKMKPKKYGDKLDLTTQGEKLPTPIYGGSSIAASTTVTDD